MTDGPKAPDPTAERQVGNSLASAISREMVKAMKTFYGRGPSKAKSYLVDDLLFVVMRDGMTEGEKTMLQADEADAVRAFRQRFENIMTERLVGTIEQLTERKVTTYQSQVLFDPHVIVEIFVFDKQVERSALEETARELLSDDDEGAVTSDDPKTDPD
ncbi:MAG: hypothetical protein JWO14_2034 [Solirubrobacterales bacterium]|nr:hypothetical protein [Solirubrobacterales bacterium]